MTRNEPLRASVTLATHQVISLGLLGTALYYGWSAFPAFAAVWIGGAVVLARTRRDSQAQPSRISMLPVHLAVPVFAVLCFFALGRGLAFAASSIAIAAFGLVILQWGLPEKGRAALGGDTLMTSLAAQEFDLSPITDDLPTQAAVKAVVTVCLTPDVFEGAVVLRSPLLQNRRMSKLLGSEPFRVVSDPTVVALNDWVAACHGDGHLSVWFLTNDPSRLEAGIGSTVRTGPGQLVRLGGEEGNWPLVKSQFASLEALLSSGALANASTAFCFSHDGAQLYRIALR